MTRLDFVLNVAVLWIVWHHAHWSVALTLTLLVSVAHGREER